MRCQPALIPILFVIATLPLWASQRAGAFSACDSCVHEAIQHSFRIEGHSVFDEEQPLAESCSYIEFQDPVFRVSADGTASSIFEVEHIVTGSCQSPRVLPEPVFLDGFTVVGNPDPAVYGEIEMLRQTDVLARFRYTHPTVPPPPGEKYREVRMGMRYVSNSPANPGALVLEGRFTIRVFRAPVLMLHGLWGRASAFSDMEQELQSSHYERHQLLRHDYSDSNDSSLEDNAERVPDGVHALVQQNASAAFAAGKVDIVNHSMGGLLSRMYVQSDGYEDDVHRIVTSNTPHAGSQMANLLLDQDYDSDGRLCKLLAVFMSAKFLGLYGCYNGGVEDLQVGSPAIAAIEEGEPDPDVAVHAIATEVDPTALFPSSSPRITTWSELLAEILQRCSANFIDSVFDSDEHDLVVSATSQAGGLDGERTSLYPEIAHVGSVADAAVTERVRDLLAEDELSIAFTKDGFPGAEQAYTTPRVCPSLARTGGSSAPGSSVEITAPTADTQILPNQPVRVDVSASPDVATILVVLGQDPEALVVADAPGPDASFDVVLPGSSSPGEAKLVALGFDAAGVLVADAEPTDLQVLVPAVLERLLVYPPELSLRPCRVASIEIQGEYDDGVTRDLTATAWTASFEAGHASRVEERALIRLDEAGDDVLTVALGALESEPVPIRALGPDSLGVCPAPDLDSDGDGVPDTTDNCTLVPNADQADVNAEADDDGSLPGVQHYGDACDADLDDDGVVESSDYFSVFRPCLGADVAAEPSCDPADLDGDGVVAAGDFFSGLRPAFGSVPGPGITEEDPT